MSKDEQAIIDCDVCKGGVVITRQKQSKKPRIQIHCEHGLDHCTLMDFLKEEGFVKKPS